MALKIKANSLFLSRYLKVTPTGIIFQETAALGGKRRFSFGQVDYILMSPSNVLSFQIGQETFSIPIKPAKVRHQQVIEALIAGCAREFSSRFPVEPAPR